MLLRASCTHMQAHTHTHSHTHTHTRAHTHPRAALTAGGSALLRASCTITLISSTPCAGVGAASVIAVPPSWGGWV